MEREPWAAPAPVTVWMVHLDRAVVNDDIKGTLAVEDDVLSFTAAAGRQPTGFPFESILAVKRVRGSPVLLIDWRHAQATRRTAFYFIQPPPLPTRGARANPDAWNEVPDRPNPFKAFRNGKRRNMRVNSRYLQQVGQSKRELIQSWAEEVAARIAASR